MNSGARREGLERLREDILAQAKEEAPGIAGSILGWMLVALALVALTVITTVEYFIKEEKS